MYKEIVEESLDNNVELLIRRYSFRFEYGAFPKTVHICVIVLRGNDEIVFSDRAFTDRINVNYF
jgi:hypothetical protein